jgi:radical SAM superfamily enzyme YgiQ (UPF0313 family)
MRILFVEVDTERSWAVASIGPGFLGAYLRAHGHEVAFYRAKVETSADDVVAHVAAVRPDLLGVSLTSRQWLRGRDLIQAIRRAIDVPVIAGGLHPTFAPEAVIATKGFDFVCLGEGEGPILDLVRALEAGESAEGIDNLWTRQGTRPPLREPFAPLDDLPFLARDLLDEVPGVVHLSTQRGCPFPCTYCAARMYDQLYGRAQYGRRRSQANVLAELAEIRRHDPLSYVIFLDDTFTIHHSWVREFCRGYREQIGVPFSLHARVETVNADLLQLLGDAGCQQITYGVESGSERIRTEVMKRPVSNQCFWDVFRWTRDAGIQVTANYILGTPGETRDDLQATFDLAAELDVLDFGYFVFYPYPGTQLFHECRDKGYLPDDYLERPANHRRSILRLPGLTDADIQEYYAKFTALRRERYRARYGILPPEDEAAHLDHVDALAESG